MAVLSPGFWADMTGLYQWGVGAWGALKGKFACFHLELTERHVECEDSYLIVAHVRKSLQLECARTNSILPRPSDVEHATGKVLVRVTKQAFDTVLKQATTVRVVQAFVHYENDMVVLDATASPTFFAGTVTVRQDECVEVAEIFAGGFGGWHRAVSVLRHAQVRIHTSWCVEKDPECTRLFAACSPSVEVIRDLGFVDYNPCPQDTLVIEGDFTHEWWRPISSLRPVKIACFSPPCQPWSQAARQAGLDSEDGRLVLKASDFLKATGIPIAIFEEVAQFPKHPHFGVFYASMEAAGYRCAWKGALQLAEISAGSRLRYFMVWIRSEVELTDKPIIASVWQSLQFPSLQKMGSVFDVLPAPLLDPCLLAAETLDLYLDPCFLPKGKFGRVSRASVQEQRIITPAQQAGCIMAMYHSQHHLPRDLLFDKGLLGCLLQSKHGPRFLASPEICSIHGASFAVMIPNCDKTAMRVLGNSLAVQQATMVLSLALQATPAACPEPHKCVEVCNALRLTSVNSLLLETEGGWFLCHQEYAGELLSRASLRNSVLCRLQVPNSCFREVLIASGQGPDTRLVKCFVSYHLGLQHLCRRFGFLAEDARVVQDASCVKIDLPVPVRICLVQPSTNLESEDPCIHVFAAGHHFFMHRHQPDAFIQLYQIFTLIPGHEAANVECYTLTGSRCRSIGAMPGAVLAVPSVQDLMHETPLGLQTMLRDCRPIEVGVSLTIEVPHDVAVDWWLAFPTHFASALGLVVEHSHFPPPEGANMLVSVWANPTKIAFDMLEVRAWLRVLLFLAPARYHDSQVRRQCQAIAARKVAFQVVGLNIWEGSLPVTLRPTDVEEWWSLASHCVGLDPNARVYSGAFPLPPGEPLSQVASNSGPGRVIRRRTGALLLTLMPALYGGGAKEEKKQGIQSQVAKLCLSNGYNLAEANSVTAKLVQQVGQPQLSRALEGISSAQQWDHVLALIDQVGIHGPTQQEMATRVARRVHAQAKKKQIFSAPLCASDFTLAGGFFLNQDGSEAAVLRSVVPRASGVILMDASAALSAIQDLVPYGPDELAIIILGHHCPHAESCSQRLQFPASTKTDDGHVLVSGCMHNLGERKITIGTRQVGSVSVFDTVACGFSAYRDEWQDGSAWQNLVTSPVKTILDMFRQEGAASVVMQPWARVFKLDGKVTTPSLCNFVQFQAHIPKDSLEPLLRLSGHKSAYVVPRAEDGQLLPGYAVVWVASQKSEAIRASMSVREQAGIVRSKGRYGIRVPDSAYEAVFRAIKPHGEPQPRVQVRYLYKLCPVPAGATEAAIAEWSRLQKWPLKILKSLGPREWLVGASMQPPDGWLMFNSETILTIPVPQRIRQQQVVQASARPVVKSGSRQDEEHGAPPGVDPWLHTDPWTEYRKQHAQVVAAPTALKAAPLARSLPADTPIADRFHSQDVRLQKLEQTVLRLQEGQEEQRQQAKSDKDALTQSLSSMSVQFAQSMEAMQQAHQRQQEQLFQGMADLKAIVLAVGGEGSQKKPRKTNQEVMQLDDPPKL